MAVAGTLHDFPLLDVINAVGHQVGRLVFSGLPTAGKIEFDVEEGFIKCCRVGDEQQPVRDVARITDKLILVNLSGTGDFIFHPLQAPSLQHEVQAALPDLMRGVLAKCDEIRTSARDFDSPMQKFRWINQGPSPYTGELGDFLRETSAMLRRGTNANEISQTLILAVPHVQFFLLFMKEEGVIAPAEPPPGRTKQQMMTASAQAGGLVPAAQPPPDPNAKWFYLERDKEVGPVTEDVIHHRIASGQMLASSLVWRQGLSRWTPYEDVRTLDKQEAIKRSSGEVDEGSIPETCYVSGRQFPRSEMMYYQGVWVAEKHRAEFFKKLNSVGYDIRAGRKDPGHLGLRLAAYIIDCTVFFLAVTSLWIVLAKLGVLEAGYFLSPLYLFADLGLAVIWGTVHLGVFSTTPGKWIFHLRVVNVLNDRHVHWGPALRRSLCSLIPLGFISIFFNPDRRAVHDLLAGTRVIHWTAENSAMHEA